MKTFNDIQEEINNANENDTIYLNGTYKGDGEPIIVNKNKLIIDGQNRTTLDAQTLSRIFDVEGCNIRLINLNLINGKADDGGAIYWWEEDGSVFNCNFTNNTANYGGAILWSCFGYNGGVVNCTFTNNTAKYDGGAIHWGGIGSVVNCYFSSTKDYEVSGIFKDINNLFKDDVESCSNKMKIIKKYRKKPVVVEAYVATEEEYIKTLEGTMKADVGDYVITGVNGEKYPCKPDVFKETYELVK